MHKLPRGIAAILISTLLALPPAAADEEFPEDQVSFQVEAEREVENDRAVAVMGVTAEHRDPAQLAEQINTSMRWALDQLPGQKAIKARSGTYQTYPVYDDKRIERWRGRQELRLESADVQSLSQTLGILQERLQIQSLQFSVSPEKRRELEAALIREALATFRQRAQLVREALEADGYSLMDVSVHTGGGQPPRPVHAEAMTAMSRAALPAPALDQGTSRVSVQVSGRIQLLRD
jgi:predicted secreted protein